MGVRESVRALIREFDPEVRAVLETVLDVELQTMDMERPRVRAAINDVIDAQLKADPKKKT
jgi:hypothetical protein